MRTVRLRLLGLALVLIFGLVGLIAIGTGVTLDGKESPAMQCTSGVGPRPSVGGPYYEQTKVTGERTWFPFGMACTYDAPDDGVGPQTVITAHWVQTVMWIGSSILVVFGLVLLVRPDFIARRKRTATG